MIRIHATSAVVLLATFAALVSNQEMGAGATQNANDLVSAFAQPRPDYSPVPIWWWSGDKIDRDRLRRQLEHIAAGGIHNAIVLNLAPSGPLYGSAADDPPFLSEEWWDLFAYAVQEGKRVGVRLWFYDQLGFSGSGLQARVVARHPEFRGIGLRHQVRDVTGPADIEIRTPPDGTPLAAFVSAVAADANAAAWIWDAAALNAAGKRYFRRTFDLGELPAHAELHITCDNGYVVYVNGAKAGEDAATYAETGWKNAENYDLTGKLRTGRNVIAIAGDNLADVAGLLVEVVADGVDGKRRNLLVSDGSFRVSASAPEGWTMTEFDDAAWKPAHVIGQTPAAPWGAVIGIGDPYAVSMGTRISEVRRIDGAIEDGVLKTAVPAGPHRVQLFYTAAGGFDYHNPAAGAALIDVVHGEMERRFGNELGKGIAGSFQDEFPAMPRFSKRLIAEYQARHHYDLIDCLPALYDDVTDAPDGRGTMQVRCNANDLAAELCEEAFFIPLHEWHERHGLLCGYDQTNRNADPIGGEGYYVDYFKTMRHYSAPGNDHGGDAKPHQSIADLYGRPRVWIEGFHSSGWGQTLEDIMTLLHPWVADGSTLYNPHAIYYSTHGSFYEWAPPDTGWRQPYFAHHPHLADYVSRMCWLLTRGRHVADVAVLHPVTTVHAASGFGHASAMGQQAKAAYWAVQNTLRAERLDYIVIDEDSIERAAIANGRLGVGNASIRMLVLPAARVLRDSTVVQLGRFTNAGGTIVVVGAAPASIVRSSTEAADKADIEVALHDAIKLDEAAKLPAVVVGKLGRDLTQKRPYLHRKVGDRDFYFIMSDDGTPANFGTRHEVAKRRLWELPAAKGGRLSVEVAADGLPECWDATTGNVSPILNYRRANGRTQLHVELERTPAPIVAIRPAPADQPTAIESDLLITGIKRSPDTQEVILQGMPRLDATQPPPAEHTARVEFADGVYTGSAPAVKPTIIDVPGPLAFKLEPTMDNRDGDFAWPPRDEPLPVEVRAFCYHEEQMGEDTAAFKSPDFDDSQWETVIAGYGPRAGWIGPIAIPAGQTFETMGSPAGVAGKLNFAEYSLQYGINEDPIYPSALGGKGRIPEEFINIENAKAGEVYVVRTEVSLPPATYPADDEDLRHQQVIRADPTPATGRPATLRIGGAARKRAFLNGQEVKFEVDDAARIVQAKVTLMPGSNLLEVMAARTSDGRLRLFYHFLPADQPVLDPQWIWAAKPSPTGRITFTRTIDVPENVDSAAMVVALGDLHQIRINGRLVADQGNFDPYFTGRSERYDIGEFLKKGPNKLEIEARDTGTPTGLLLDGLIETVVDGQQIGFVSDASFKVAPTGQPEATAPARVLSGPSHGYFGETATLLLRPRPHPLPYGGFLVDEKRVFDPIYVGGLPSRPDKPTIAWYRFLVPPGARRMRFGSGYSPEVKQLYVDGKEVPTDRFKAYQFADLPDVRSPRRTAALRIECASGDTRGAALWGPIEFEMGAGRIPLGSLDELGLPHYAGGIRYLATVSVPAAKGRAILDVGRVRGSVDVTVNGRACGTRLWHPYRFDVTQAVRPGDNRIEIRLLNTLGPHFGVGHPSWHVFENQTKSGVYGPISITTIEPVELRLNRASN
ncbi:MAG: hypothetical protein HY718_13565 [Planctomycetes bacterium]|nr:hypothetical protein [Planctomycetota bacterium]